MLVLGVVTFVTRFLDRVFYARAMETAQAAGGGNLRCFSPREFVPMVVALGYVH